MISEIAETLRIAKINQTTKVAINEKIAQKPMNAMQGMLIKQTMPRLPRLSRVPVFPK